MNLSYGTYVSCGRERRLGFIRGTATFQHQSDSEVIHLYIVDLDVEIVSADGKDWISVMPYHPDDVVEVKRELQHE